MKCQIEGCKSKSKYALYKTYPDGSKQWLQVCREHEQEIGLENLRRAGGNVKKKIKEER